MWQMKTVAVVFAIVVGAIVCVSAALGTGHLMHLLDSRPDLVAATQPWLFLNTLVLVGVAAILMARRRAD
jgi:nicotinamide riboside transporter PnuC